MKRIALLLALALAPAVAAQRGADGPRVPRLDAPQTNLTAAPAGPIARADLAPGASTRPAILLTGYWPPSNEAIRRFSPDPVQNPDGWLGADWEGRGYDVYAYFPEFTPPDCTSCGKGSGDLEVDYQDTSADFWPIADALQPIAVITFSRGFDNKSWELEMNQYNREANNWISDFVSPFKPTPAPPDASVPRGHLRLSTLPVDAIVEAVDLANLGLQASICFSGDGGAYLSEFIAYHGVWYQDLHKDPTDPAWCIAGGHVHVGGQIGWAKARKAAETTVRTVIHYVDGVLDPACQDVTWYCETEANSAGRGAFLTTTGSTSILSNELTFLVNYAPANQFGLVFYGAGRDLQPFGDGSLCVLAPLYRVLPPAPTDADGFASVPVDLTAPPFSSGGGQVLPGSSWNFQFWYRDPAAGGATYNATNGVEVVFCP